MIPRGLCPLVVTRMVSTEIDAHMAGGLVQGNPYDIRPVNRVLCSDLDLLELSELVNTEGPRQ